MFKRPEAIAPQYQVPTQRTEIHRSTVFRQPLLDIPTVLRLLPQGIINIHRFEKGRERVLTLRRGGGSRRCQNCGHKHDFNEECRSNVGILKIPQFKSLTFNLLNLYPKKSGL